MKKYKLTTIIFSALFIVSSFFPVASLARDKTSIEHIINSINSIQKYQVNLNTKIFPPNASDLDPIAPDEFDPTRFMSVQSVVYGESGKKMKILTIMKSPELGTEMEHILIFDGTWLWVEQKVNKHPQMKTIKPMISAMKIHIPSVSPDPVDIMIEKSALKNMK